MTHNPQHFAKTMMGYTSLHSILNVIIGVTSYCCVILKMVILHDAIKAIQKKTKTCFFSKKQKRSDLKKTKYR